MCLGGFVGVQKLSYRTYRVVDTDFSKACCNTQDSFPKRNYYSDFVRLSNWCVVLERASWCCVRFLIMDFSGTYLK